MRGVLFVVLCAVVGYIGLIAAVPEMPHGWFGRPEAPSSTLSVAIVTAVIAVVCVVSYRYQITERPGTFPVVTIALLVAVSAILAFASFARCADGAHPPLFTALMWTAGTVKGAINDFSLDTGPCPAHPTPVALVVARIAGMAAVYVTVVSGAIALLRTQLDRARLRSARRVTAVVDVDDDSRPMIGCVAATMNAGSRLAAIVGAGSKTDPAELRRLGARVIALDLSQLDGLRGLPFWPRLERLYLLSSSPSANLLRLKAINDCIPSDSGQRLPLVVRIDDPWQAEAWRVQQLGQRDTRWTPDVVGVYEATAARLLAKILADPPVTRIVVCGTTPLTLAFCSLLVRRRLERGYYAAPGSPDLPALTIVAPDADDFLRDHHVHQQQLGLAPDGDWLDGVAGPPTMTTLSPLVATAGDACSTAVILATPDAGTGEKMLSTRLASQFPALPIYALDPKRPDTTDVELAPIVGRLHTFRLVLDTESGDAHDVFERAAMLIHERYRRKDPPFRESDVPWPQLSTFYRESNRRQVRNAFKMVEQIAGHTWDTFGAPPDPPPPADGALTDPVEQALALLQTLGFDRDSAVAMAEAEHDSWYDFLRAAGWRLSPTGEAERNEKARTRPDLVPWSKIAGDPAAMGTALRSLADTIDTLCQLGYRSKPAPQQWHPYRRLGEVTAERHQEPWSWNTESGATMHAAPGDWKLHDADGSTWSVRDDRFRATYEPVDHDNPADRKHWRRIGIVQARRARDTETIPTLEGEVPARDTDWVVRDDSGAQWVVPGDKFAQRYVVQDPAEAGAEQSSQEASPR
jgi:hypothetical protein